MQTLNPAQALNCQIVMYGCESWIIKKAERQRINVFELWCCRRLLRVPGTAGRSNQSILKEISPEYSLEGLMLKLKLQYFGHLMVNSWFTGKDLMLGNIEGRKRRGWQRIRWSEGITESINGHEFEQIPGDDEGHGSLVCCNPWGQKDFEYNLATDQQPRPKKHCLFRQWAQSKIVLHNR